MTKLRDRRKQASQTSKATKRIGLVAQLVITAGIAPFGKGITNALKEECFRQYDDGPEENTRKKVHEVTQKAIEFLPAKNFQVGPVLNVKVVNDTNMTTSRWRGNMYSMKDYDAGDRFTHKRHSEFIFDHMSAEINDLEGKPFWAHVAWKNLPEGDTYGGDYSQINVDNNDELSIVITYLPNKRAATDLVKQLREGSVTTDDLCLARGYDVEGIRKAIGKALNEASDDNKDVGPGLTDIGKKTKIFYQTLQGFIKPSTLKFLNENIKDGDLEALSEKCGADVGDIAILMNKPEYFQRLIEATGKEPKDAVVDVARKTGLANPADLAAFLNITEAAF